MKTEDLLNLGNYQKVDFFLIAGNASNVDGIAALRPPTREERLSGLGVKLTVESAQTRSYRKPTLSHQELATALAGCKRMPTLSAFYHVRGDYSVYPELHRGLMLELCRIAGREKWPLQINKRDGSRGYYQCELVSLVLDYQANIPVFIADPGKFALCVGVSDDVWSKVVRHWYDSMTQVYERWVATARGHVGRPWTSDEPEGYQAMIEARLARQSMAFSDSQYRCLVAYMMHWRGTCDWEVCTLEFAMKEVGITASKEDVVSSLYKAGFTYHPTTERISYVVDAEAA